MTETEHVKPSESLLQPQVIRIIVEQDNGTLQYIEGDWAQQLVSALKLLMDYTRRRSTRTELPVWKEVDIAQAQMLFVQQE